MKLSLEKPGAISVLSLANCPCKTDGRLLGFEMGRDRLLLQWLLAAVTVIGLCCSAMAQDCGRLMNPAFLAESDIDDPYLAGEVLKLRFCSGDLGVGHQRYGDQQGVNFAPNFEQWRRDHCGPKSRFRSGGTISYYVQLSLSPDAMAEWQNCALSIEGLSCLASPTDRPEEFEVTVQWRNDAAVVFASTVTNARVVGSAFMSRLLEPDFDLRGRPTTVRLLRDNPERQALVTVSATLDDGTSDSCVAYVPPMPAQSPTVSYATDGAWCFTAPDSDYLEFNESGGTVTLPIGGKFTVQPYDPPTMDTDDRTTYQFMGPDVIVMRLYERWSPEGNQWEVQPLTSNASDLVLVHCG